MFSMTNPPNVLVSLSRRGASRVELNPGRMPPCSTPFATLILRTHRLSEVPAEEVVHRLRDNVPGYYTPRDDLMGIAAFLADRRDRVHPAEAAPARLLLGLLQHETLGS